MTKSKHLFIQQKKRRLLQIILINFVFSTLQIIASIFARSNALLSDAVHNMADSMSIILSYIAIWISEKRSDNTHTFGYKRAEIITSFVNGLLLFAVAIVLIIQSIENFIHPARINTIIVITFALLGVIINFGSAIILHQYQINNLNIRSAYFHLLLDGLTSVAVLISGIAIHFFKIDRLDSVISIVIAIYISYISYNLVKESIQILMQFAPYNLNIKTIKNRILSYDTIESIHHLHIWQLNDSEIHLETHLVIKNNLLISETELILQQIRSDLAKEFKINHTILQTETALTPDCCNKEQLIINGCYYN